MTKSVVGIIASIILFMAIPITTFAIDTDKPLDDPALQTRYEALNERLRCLVCMNQNIADSNSDLAATMRAQVRRLLLEGKTDAQIADYMTARYGDFVLYKPPVQPNTWLLWAGPFLLLALAAVALLLAIRRRARLPGADADTDPDTDSEDDA